MRRLRLKTSATVRLPPGIPTSIAVTVRRLDGAVFATYDGRTPLLRFESLADFLELHQITESDLEELERSGVALSA